MEYGYFVYYNQTPIAAFIFKKDAKRLLKKRKKTALVPNAYMLKDSAGRILIS